MECFVPLMEKFNDIYHVQKKETADKKHHTNPYRAVNYIRDENGNPICPNGRKFLFKRKQHVRYKKYGRTEEIYPNLLSVPFLHKTVTIFKKYINVKKRQNQHLSELAFL